MKSKTLVWMYLLVLSLGTILSLYIPKNEVAAKDSIVIPGDAIRLRILANSDKESDQALKRKVRDAVNAQITLWVKNLTSLDKAKEVIQGHLPELEQTAERVVRDEGANQSVKVEFSQKVQFPTKLYGDFLYPAGDYQAVLITLGEGKGANWWCVLFPPLCFLDFSNGVAVSDGFEDKEKTAVAASARVTEDQSKPKVQDEKAKQPAVKTQTEKKTVKKAEKPAADTKTVEPVQQQEPAPVYTAEDEQPVKVKFFIVELFQRLFD